MKRFNSRMDGSEVFFKFFSYLFVGIFALFCLYPFVFAISAMLSGREAFEGGQVILFPVDIQFDAFMKVIKTPTFWISYANTLFLTVFGTAWSMFLSVLGGYALSKKRLFGHRVLNFLMVFTMWFAAGMIPTYLNYMQTKSVLSSFGIIDEKWLVVIAMGVAVFNVILLRNAFDGIPSEIEEAAKVDGATEFQILSKVYLPMSKASIATVTLFYAISRWNGYFWARRMVSDPNSWPLQVFIRSELEFFSNGDNQNYDNNYAPDSYIYAMIVCAIIPIIIIYPFIQKYFAAGVNVGGVKE